MSDGFEYQFPAIRGVQAQREYYVSMCPMRLLPRLFQFDEDELAPELRAQRQLNRARIPELSRYITENVDDYVFSAITVSIDADIAFKPVAGEGEENRIGILKIPMSARFIINDGQHRRAAIDDALRNNPELGDETIAVVFFIDKGLERCQQMFADLNRYAIRPSPSLSILYDYRDETAALVKSLIGSSDIFRDVVELEKTSLAPRSRRLFTLSAIYHATNELLMGVSERSPEDAARLALEFWEAVAEQMGDWNRVRHGELTAGEVRKDFIHTHGVVLQALARTGRALISRYPKGWKREIAGLKTMDWRRANSKMWEGRALVGGQLSKAHQNITLTANAIKTHLGLELSEEEQRVEDAFNRGTNGIQKASA
ncbi:DNA sulfur modification protein DndB [Maritimibacter sp. 55A14]|uniref:DNA sulfur modification protein DndB n=1 Tax=Maritimibacter sp. 55A14 TaxID=2174844 RepID=UPI000D605649|nr:DNA sulfur modification protein DndB [Maritimibacter sp. 55A14]PWE34118.1 DNA sulfur modification protein DndB [Maritimibacter sp. 55A14]